jgi:4-deoxy-L-threo-5-hexosulose-uronate ketol-isomerase
LTAAGWRVEPFQYGPLKKSLLVENKERYVMKILELADKIRFPKMSTDELRETFLVQHLFQPDVLEMVYVDLDRTVVGSAVPVRNRLRLETAPELRSTYFLERRELGVLNIGAGKGVVSVGDREYELAPRDCLYIGRGNESVTFASRDSAAPAEFYLLSYPAHASYPTGLSTYATLAALQLGSPISVNRREIRKHIWQGGVASCQLVMGVTQLSEGSAWNTMPPHTHMRRSEVYLYFDLPEDERVLHLMGPPNETRHLVVKNKQIAISPGWSIHAGAGTHSYAFCWGMGGENQAYDDMDPVKIADLR